MRQPLLNVLKFLFRGYQLMISPFLHIIVGPGGGCRFEPSCSRYAMDALQIHGGRHGFRLILRRICKCHPWGGSGGYDPVPSQNQQGAIK